MAEQDTRAHIEATTEALKHEMRQIADQARSAAWMIQEHGLTIGEPRHQLFTGGPGDWEAPTIHPVWAPELAQEARTLERMGAATFEYEPTYRMLDEWRAAGKPEMSAEDDWGGQTGSLQERAEALLQEVTDHAQAQQHAHTYGLTPEDIVAAQRDAALMIERLGLRAESDLGFTVADAGHDEQETEVPRTSQERVDALRAQVTDPTQEKQREQGWGY